MARTMDDKPTFSPDGKLEYDEGLWCGAVVHHYGHMIADFGMRLVRSAWLHPEVPLVFSATVNKKGVLQEPPPFFWEMVEYFSIDRQRILLVGQPVLFQTLHVYPQAERIDGPPPDVNYLKLLNRLNPVHKAWKDKPIKFLYVSRSRYLPGGLAGESYLDQVLESCGVHVIHPETLSLKRQISLYGSSQQLLFSEGSALHTLQLMGRLHARIGVLVRRPGTRLAESALVPRAKSVDYLEVTCGLVHGLRVSGHSNQSKGISVLDENAVLEQLERMHISVRRQWNSKKFLRQREHDIKAWAALRINNPKAHVNEEKTIRKTLARLPVTVSID